MAPERVIPHGEHMPIIIAQQRNGPDWSSLSDRNRPPVRPAGIVPHPSNVF
jgi:hypothetical protein